MIDDTTRFCRSSARIGATSTPSAARSIKIEHARVAVHEVDARVAVQHLVAAQSQLAHVRVQHREPVTLAVVRGERVGLVGSIVGVLGIDEHDLPVRPADRVEVLEQVLEQQLAHVVGELESDARILRQQRRHDEIGEDAHRGRPDVQAADAAQVRLHELDRVLPHRRRVVDDGVEAGEDRIRFAMRRRPAVAQPLFLDRRTRRMSRTSGTSKYRSGSRLMQLSTVCEM